MTTVIVDFAGQKVFADTQMTHTNINDTGGVVHVKESLDDKLTVDYVSNVVFAQLGDNRATKKFMRVFPEHVSEKDFGCDSLNSRVLVITNVDQGLKVREYRFKRVLKPLWLRTLVSIKEEDKYYYRTYEYAVWLKTEGFKAFGSGQQYAEAVVLYEKDAKRAIEVVSSLDPLTNNSIQTVEVPSNDQFKHG